MGGKQVTPEGEPKYPEWKIWAWRTVRGAFWTTLATVLMVPMDWSVPEMAIKLLLTSFGAGFGQAVFRALREKAQEEAGKEAAVTRVVTKLPV